MGRFKKLPVVISATRWSPNKLVEGVVPSPVLEPTEGNPSGEYGQIKTLEGTMICLPGDWIITGVNGEIYPCKDEIFKKTYAPVDLDGLNDWNKGE